jgi:hypothetical protein
MCHLYFYTASQPPAYYVLGFQAHFSCTFCVCVCVTVAAVFLLLFQFLFTPRAAGAAAVLAPLAFLASAMLVVN